MERLLDHLSSVPAWLSAIMATIVAGAGLFFAAGKVIERLDNQDKKIKKITDVQDFFHGQCDTVTETLSSVMTKERHQELCEERQARCMGHVCKKIDDLLVVIRKTDIKVDGNRDAVTAQFTRIEHFMGRIEGILEVKSK